MAQVRSDREAHDDALHADRLLEGGWELIVGLEVHVELDTATKLFSASPNRFGDEPNTNIDPVTLGLPGALPVLNRHAVELAMRIGAALNCTIQACTFHRKNYFYPDMPKAYQISQYDQPLNVDGSLDLPNGVRIGIERAHLEEDTGKSTHVGGSGGRIHGSDYSLIDFNRAGVPLVEIVSRPDIRTAEQARQYVTELRAILVAIGASDAKMEEGSMRCDANVSVHKPGTPFGTRCEIKNVNSVRSLGRAIEYEARRQIAMIGAGETVRQETRHWDENDGRTHTLRTKEDADDYRYFLEPDLVPLEPSARVDRGRPRGHADAAGRAPPAVGGARRHRRRQRGRDGGRRARPGPVRGGGWSRRWRHRPRRRLREGGLRRAGERAGGARHRSGAAHQAGGVGQAHRHPGQDRAGRARRQRRRRCRGDRRRPRGSRRWTPRRWKRWSIRRSRRSPTHGRSSAPARARRWALSWVR